MSARPPARILIVEDTIQFADLVRVALRNLDAEIVHVMSASAALITIEQFHPDLVLLDIGLPDMDGWHLLETLRQEPCLQSEAPAIVVMTAYGDPANRLIGKLQGVDGYVIKPCSIHEVRHAVAEALHLLDTAELTDPRA